MDSDELHSSRDTSSLEGKVRRAIDFREGDEPDEDALKALIRAAVSLNKPAARSRRAR